MVTVHDVARAAGVSISTVSRALATPQKVAAPTRERVAAAARELGYLPNRAASGLRAGRTRILGLMVPDLENPYFAAVTKGVQQRARALGLGVFVVDAEEDVDLEVELLRGLAEQTDGVLLCSPRVPLRDTGALGRRPVVLVNHRVEGLGSVASDQAGAAELAVEHLRALGHRRIAYVGGPARSWTDERRREGLARAAERWPDVEVLGLGPYRPHVEGGRAAADVVVGSGATAAITYNDLVAVGLVQRLRARGLDVPRDLSVVGSDDTFVASLVAPGLTTLRTDLRDLGRRAVDLLVEIVERRHPDAPVPAAAELPVELVVRGSTAVAPASRDPGPRADQP